MNHNYIILNLFISHYIILLYYIILHFTYILLLIFNLFKGSNGNVKLERSRLGTRQFLEKDL